MDERKALRKTLRADVAALEDQLEALQAEIAQLQAQLDEWTAAYGSLD